MGSADGEEWRRCGERAVGLGGWKAVPVEEVSVNRRTHFDRWDRLWVYGMVVLCS